MHNEKDEKKVNEGGAVAPADDDEALVCARAIDPFKVVRFFRERGRSYRSIAEIGFWFHDAPDRPVTGLQLRRWYEIETKCRR